MLSEELFYYGNDSLPEESLRTEDKRRFRRVSFREPVQFRTQDQAEPAGCIAYDISERGIRIKSQNFIPIRKEMALTLPLGFGIQVDLLGRVVWVQREPHSEYYQIGLEFLSVQADNRMFQDLQEYIESH